MGRPLEREQLPGERTSAAQALSCIAALTITHTQTDRHTQTRAQLIRCWQSPKRKSSEIGCELPFLDPVSFFVDWSVKFAIDAASFAAVERMAVNGERYEEVKERKRVRSNLFLIIMRCILCSAYIFILSHNRTAATQNLFLPQRKIAHLLCSTFICRRRSLIFSGRMHSHIEAHELRFLSIDGDECLWWCCCCQLTSNKHNNSYSTAIASRCLN